MRPRLRLILGLLGLVGLVVLLRSSIGDSPQNPESPPSSLLAPGAGSSSSGQLQPVLRLLPCPAARDAQANLLHAQGWLRTHHFPAHPGLNSMSCQALQTLSRWEARGLLGERDGDRLHDQINLELTVWQQSRSSQPLQLEEPQQPVLITAPPSLEPQPAGRWARDAQNPRRTWPPALPESFTPNSKDALTVRSSPTFQMYVHPENVDIHISGMLRRGGIWDNHKMQALRQVYGEYRRLPASQGRTGATPELQANPDAQGRVRPMFLDVGANIGVLSLFAAAYGIETHAVEAMPHNNALLAESVRLNGWSYEYAVGSKAPHGFWQQQLAGGSQPVPGDGDGSILFHHHAVALSDKPEGELCFQSDPVNQGHSFVEGVDKGIRLNKPCTRVAVTTIDALLPDVAARSVLVLKIDVEGFEFHALKGAERMLSNPHTAPCAIWMELFPAMIRGAGSDPVQLLNWLDGVGYLVTKDGRTAIPKSGFAGLVQQYSRPSPGDLVDLHLLRKDMDTCKARFIPA